MRTLYLSDLDGTLLRSDQRTSAFTNEAVNALVGRGVLFSFATARSYHTAVKVTAGIDVRIPLIVYNGAFIVENGTQRVLAEHYFTSEQVAAIRAALTGQGLSPVVYAIRDGFERFSYHGGQLNDGTRAFVASRHGDPRDNPLPPGGDLYAGRVFYFTCIGEAEKLLPVYRQLQARFSCVYQRDIYSGDQWLEIMPAGTTKAEAALQLKQLLGCDRIVAFGDAVNDIPLFRIADACYAVENAAAELKAMATAVIPANDADGVAKWLLAHAEPVAQ